MPEVKKKGRAVKAMKKSKVTTPGKTARTTAALHTSSQLKAPPPKKDLKISKYLVRKKGQTKEEYDRKRKALTQAAYRERKKKEAASKKRLMMTSNSAWSGSEETDPFFVKVTGTDVLTLDPIEKRHAKLTKMVILHLHIEGVRQNVIYPMDLRPKLMPGDSWKIGFHMDTDVDVDDEAEERTKESIRKLPVQPWLEVKKSLIEGAGLGLFADKNFSEGSVIGLYMGGQNGDPNCVVELGDTKKHIWCYSFSDSRSFGGHTAVTMGMQMMNDPTLSEGGNVNKCKVNAQINWDLVVTATKNIKKGDEICCEYGWERHPSSSSKKTLKRGTK